MRIVIPSVQYADFLADTLPAWKRSVPASARLVVVTSPTDVETQDLARQYGVGLCVTEAWTRGGAPFNKGAALDEAFGFAGTWTTAPSERETCLSIDADVYPVGKMPHRDTLRTWRLYGCARHRCTERADFLRFRDGETRLMDYPVVLQRQKKQEPGDGTVSDRARSGQACLGYFQLFRYRHGIAFGESLSAGKYDIDFRRHFTQRIPLQDFAVLHLGTLSRKNWKGRVVPPWNEETA